MLSQLEHFCHLHLTEAKCACPSLSRPSLPFVLTTIPQVPTSSPSNNGRLLKSLDISMTSRTFLELPAEIRNDIYRHVLCYDGITPEVKSARSPWQSRTFCTRPSRNPLRRGQDLYCTERSGPRLQLDVIAPIRNGFYPGVQPPVPAGDILSLFRTCRRIYEEAHPIFWAENAFIFPDQDTMHAFTHRIGARCFALIRTLGIEKTVNAEWINLNGGLDLGYWFADVRMPPFLQALHLHGWETRFQEYDCVREHWFPDRSDPSEVKIRKSMIRCRTTYNWLTLPRTSRVGPVRDTSGVTDDGFYDDCARLLTGMTLHDSM